MSIIHNDRISAKFKYATVTGVPELSLEPLDREYSDDDLESIASVSSSVSSRAAQERRKISRAEGCFITKQTGFHLKMMHWIKPVRNDPDLKFRVERMLNDFSVVPRDFSLDQPSNLTPLDRNLHYAMEKIGLFAVTCSKETLTSLISLVKRENVTWQERSTGPLAVGYTRYFNFAQPPFSDAKFELVLLNPRHFLQKRGSALAIFTEVGDALSGKMYFVSPDGALRERPDNDAPRLGSFSSSGVRTAEDTLNPFLVVLNAEIAFRRFKKGPYTICDEYKELIDLTIDLVDKIYFQPLVDERKAYHEQNYYRGVINDVDGGEDDDEEVNYWDDEEDEDMPTRLGNSALDAKLPPPIGATEKVQQWLAEV